jgi:UDP-galactopyranose mutase
LSAAARLRSYHLVLERQARPGGLCRTESQSGFLFDHTGHFLNTRTARGRTLIRRALGNNLDTHQRSAWIYSSGIYTRYPFQANTYGLPEKVIEECLRGMLGTMQRSGVPRGRDLLSWTIRTFGNGIARHFMVPYNRKLWNTPLDRLTTDWMGRFVPRPSLQEFIEGALSDRAGQFGYNAVFDYPRTGGIESLVRGLARGCEDLCLNARVTGIRLGPDLTEINGVYQVPWRAIISTVPLPELVRLLGPAVPSRVRAAASRLRWNQVVNINLGVDRPGISGNRHWVYFPEPSYSFYRVGFPSAVCPSLAPRGKSSVSVEVSVPGGRPVSLSSMARRAKTDLIRAGILRKNDRVTAEKILHIPCGYVVYDLQRERSVRTIQEWLRSKRIWSTGRYGAWEYTTMEDALLEGEQAAEEVNRTNRTVRRCAGQGKGS